MTTTSGPHEPILDDLPSLLTGELSPAREREVADHLDSCDACRRELAVVARASGRSAPGNVSTRRTAAATARCPCVVITSSWWSSR